MTNPKNHKIERSSSISTAMSASWGFTDSDNSATNRNFHVFGVNVDDGSSMRMYTFPPNDSTWSNSDTTDSDKDFIVGSSFFPSTRWRLDNVAHHVQMQNQFPITTDVQQFVFAEPLQPKVTLSRSDLKLSWSIESRISDMPYTSRYGLGGTWYWFQTIEYGQEWPSYSKYHMPSPTGSFSGESETYSFGSQSTYTPSNPVKARLVSVNYGFSGASEITYGEEHTFAQVNEPTISIHSVKTSDSNNVTAFSVNPNADSWHPVDHMILQRQVSSSLSPNGSWTNVEDIADVASNVSYMTDESSDQIPDEDKATWWRALVWHDDDSANVAYGYPSGQPFRAGRPKAPEDVAATMNPDSDDKEHGFVTATWKSSSACSPNHVVELWGKKSQGGVFERVESKTVPEGTLSAKFEKDYSGLVSYNVRVQSYKAWSKTQKLSSEWACSTSMATVTIETVKLLEDGVSILVSESHDDDDSDITEYSWHTRGDGWSCTQEPEHYNRASTGSASHVSIAGLEEGKDYYIQARRYNSDTGKYGPYSSQVSTQAGGTPGTPTLSAPGSVSAGGSLEFEWDFSGTGQKSAMLYICPDIAREDRFTGDGKTLAFDLSFAPDEKPVVEVDGAACSDFTVNSKTLSFSSAPASGKHVSVSYRAKSEPAPVIVEGDYMSYAYDIDKSWDGKITAKVKVTTGGLWSAYSNEVSVSIKVPPTCVAGPSGTLVADSSSYGGMKLTALPLEISLGGTSDLFDVSVTCVNGTSLPAPDRTVRVSSGSNVAWATSCAAGRNSIVSKRGVVIGGGQYDVRIVGRDSATGSKSEPVIMSFTADWSYKAPEPTATVRVSGNKAIAKATANANARSGDTLSIWRKTADGAILCAGDAAFGAEYTDSVPPYGWDSNAYIFQITTVDGDTCWVEKPYSLPASGCTVNWEDESIVLPWNIDFASEYSTKFESRAHLDGSRTGYWQNGYDRSASVSGVLRKSEDASTIESVRRLGKYAGIAFVRDVRGMAFPCNVDVSIEESYQSNISSVDMKITEIDDDGTWKAKTPPVSQGA